MTGFVTKRLILLMLENGKLQYSQRSLVMRKPVSGVSNQVSLKLCCTTKMVRGLKI